MKKYVRVILFWFFLVVIFASATVGFIAARFSTYRLNAGYKAVQLMYSFEDTTELVSNYEKLYSLLNKEVWERLSIGNDSRVINSYFKFQAEPAKVIPKSMSSNTVVYSLQSEYIDPRVLWSFDYNISQGTIDDIREYKWVHTVENGGGGFS